MTESAKGKDSEQLYDVKEEDAVCVQSQLSTLLKEIWEIKEKQVWPETCFTTQVGELRRELVSDIEKKFSKLTTSVSS